MNKQEATREFEQELRDYEFKFIEQQIKNYKQVDYYAKGILFIYSGQCFIVTGIKHKTDETYINCKMLKKHIHHPSWEPHQLNKDGAFVYKYNVYEVHPIERSLPISLLNQYKLKRYDRPYEEIYNIEINYKHCE